MRLTDVAPGCVHLQRGDLAVLFGCPNEILKVILQKKLTMPSAIVLPDTFHKDGSSLVAVEFPFYHFVFVQGALAKGLKMRIYGTRSQCNRVREMLRVTLLGPTDEEMKAWKVAPSIRKYLRTELDHLAVKNADGSIKQIDEFIDFIEFDRTNTAPLVVDEDNPLSIRKLGNDRFVLMGADNGCDIMETVEIPLDRPIEPPYSTPIAQSAQLPSTLAVDLLGASNGFDPNYPTTCYLLWLSGVAVLWDCPAFTHHQLRQRGVSKESVKAIIVTHVHDDHLNFLEFLLDKHRPLVISTQEVFECLLIKMGAILGESPDTVREYIDFMPVPVEEPVRLFGVDFRFFYGVHSIPALGAEMSVRDKDGKLHSVYISGDTLHHRGLDEMHGKGLLDTARRDELKAFLNKRYDLLVMDGGGEPIHLDPKDFADSDQKIIVTHRSTYDGKLGKNAVIAKPGDSFQVVPAEPVHPYHVLGILEALKLFDIKNRYWIDIILTRGTVRNLEKGETIVREGTRGDTFYFVLAGSFDVTVAGTRVADLERGDFFGEIAILQQVERTASVTAASASTVFELPGDLFMEFVAENNLEKTFMRLWSNRQAIKEVELFAGLDASAIHRISLVAEPLTFKNRQTIVGEAEAAKAQNIYIIQEGAVRLSEGGKPLKDDRGRPVELEAGRYFGKSVMVSGQKLGRYRATAEGNCRVLVIPRDRLSTLEQEMPVIRHRIRLVMGAEPVATRKPKAAGASRRATTSRR